MPTESALVAVTISSESETALMLPGPNRMKLFKQSAIRTGALAAAFALFALSSAKAPTQSQAVADSLLPVLSQSTVISPLGGSEKIDFAVSLQPRFPAELQAFCDSVSNPSSPNYHQYLTPEQVGEAFGASATDVNNVVAFLKAQGLKVTLVSPNHMAILVEGTVAQIQKAFSTKIAQYRGPSQEGKIFTFRANSTPLLVPANLSPVVINICGIDNYARPKRMTTLSPTLARGLYNTAPSYANNIRGQGRKIGISNWDGYRITNAATFISQWGLPIPAGGSTSNIHTVSIGANYNNQDGAGEADLDIQMEISAAPLADVYIYDSTNLISTLTTEASNNVADIISESWGWRLSTSLKTSAHNQHLAMTAQGQTYLCASGDSGTTDYYPPTGGNYYPYPGTDPEVLTVGGTIATVNTSTGARISETGWSGSGGGWATDTDSFNVLPSWQHGNGVPTGNNHRLIPDIAAHSASSSGAFYVYTSGAWYGISGTSCASPYMASSFTTLEQRLAAAGMTARLGRMQDMIYAQNGRSDVWYDITSGSTGTLPDGSSASAHSGWDFVTGWGAPNFDALFNALAVVSNVPTSYQVLHGTYISGNVASLAAVDQNYLTVQQIVSQIISQPPVDVLVTGTTTVTNPSSLSFKVVAHGSTLNLNQVIRLFNVSTNSWTTVDTRTATTSDQTVTVTISSNAAQYVAANGTVQARIQYTPNAPTFSASWSGVIDQAMWTLAP